MGKNLVILVFTTATYLLALPGPLVECRFASLDEDDNLYLDELVTCPIVPGTIIDGDFDPYDIDLSVNHGRFIIDVYMDHELINDIIVPIDNILNMPIGVSLFGVNTLYYPTDSGSISFRYECRKVL